MFETILISIVFFLSIGLALAFFMGVNWVKILGGRQYLRVLAIAIGLGGTLLFALIRISSGNIDMGNGDYDNAASNITSVVWGKRLLTVFVIAAAFAGVVRYLPRFKLKGNPGILLLISYLVFIVSGMVINAKFGTVPAFLPQLFYAPMLMVTLFLVDDIEVLSFVDMCKWVSGFVLFGSLLLLVHPDWALLKTTKSFIPGFPGRLAGLTGHPNALAPIALGYLLLESLRPSRPIMRKFMIFVAIVVLVLAQSKTAWVAGLLIGAVIVGYRIILETNPFLSNQAKQRDGFIAFLGMVMLAAVGLLVFCICFDYVPLSFFRGKELDDLSTFVGRSIIWQITLDLWRHNPWFGYGPTLWSPEFRAAYHMIYVGQAHNQFVQSLGEAGLIGLGGLIIYLLSLTYVGIKLMSDTRGISLALVLLLILRCFTETPLRTLGVTDSTFFIHFIAVGVLLGVLQKKKSGAENIFAAVPAGVTI